MRNVLSATLLALALAGCGGGNTSAPYVPPGSVEVQASATAVNHAIANAIVLTVTGVTNTSATPAMYKWFTESPYPALSGTFSGTSATATIPPIAACLTTTSGGSESLNFIVWAYDASGNQIAVGGVAVQCA